MAKKEAQKTKPTETKNLRPPIVTIMGHVDHGKTSLLDAIRKTNVVATESGGITQHTAAHTVVKDGRKITFIDTPGHAAFTNMRKRGGSICDIIILVVAADDGVMPQTKEAISIAKDSGAPIIVAINKIDLEGVNVDKVKRQLSENGIQVESLGGDVVAVETSATKNIGIEALLDVINLISEMNEAKFIVDESKGLDAIVIEAKHSRKQGNIVSVLIKNGTISIKDEIIAIGPDEVSRAKVKSITLEGKPVAKAGVGDAIDLMGFEKLPLAGSLVKSSDFNVEEVQAGLKDMIINRDFKPVLETGKILNVVLKADTQGTLEAVMESLYKLDVDGAKVNILHASTGDVKESDVLLASNSKAILVGFKVKADSQSETLASEKKVLLALYDIIYKLIEEIEGALEGVMEIEEGKIKGRGLVIQLFKLPKSNMTVAGTLVEAGKFRVNNRIAIYRGEDREKPVFVSRIRSIHIGQNEVDNANKGEEAGLLFKPQLDELQLDDVIEVI